MPGLDFHQTILPAPNWRTLVYVVYQIDVKCPAIQAYDLATQLSFAQILQKTAVLPTFFAPRCRALPRRRPKYRIGQIAGMQDAHVEKRQSYSYAASQSPLFPIILLSYYFINQ